MTLQEYKEREERERKVIGEAVTDKVLAIIARKFGVHLACFQGVAGKYDPLDAMRRDAYREVYHWLRKTVMKYRKENKL